MRLTREERARVLRGDYRPLSRESEPDCEPGEFVVVSRGRPQRYADRETGEVITVPSYPLLTIRLAKPQRHTAGGWIVRITEVRRHDKETRLLAPSASQEDYTTNPARAIDHLQAEGDEQLKRYAIEAKRKREQQRESESIDMQARVIAEKLAKLQREAAKLGVDFAPRLRALIAEWNRELVQHRRNI